MSIEVEDYSDVVALVNRLANVSEYPLFGKYQCYCNHGYYYADSFDLLSGAIADDLGIEVPDYEKTLQDGL